MFNTYLEPFVGGGALFFALQPADAVLNDLNPRLVECYKAVRDDPDRVIDALRRLNNSKTEYYRIRASKPRTSHTRAAAFIYLCTLSFNGIYRENLNGQFNVPYGHKTKLNVCDHSRIYAVSEALQRVTLLCGDFLETTRRAMPGDLIYLDPPYTVAHNNNGFTKYNAHLFSWRDQERLAMEAKRLSDLGCYVIVSNAFHRSLISLYDAIGFRIVQQERTSRIAAESKYRGTIVEALFVSQNGLEGSNLTCG